MAADGRTPRPKMVKPRIVPEHTGYSGDDRRQWAVYATKKGRALTFGGPLVCEATVAEALRYFADKLQRIGACRG